MLVGTVHDIPARGGIVVWGRPSEDFVVRPGAVFHVIDLAGSLLEFAGSWPGAFAGDSSRAVWDRFGKKRVYEDCAVGNQADIG